MDFLRLIFGKPKVWITKEPRIDGSYITYDYECTCGHKWTRMYANWQSDGYVTCDVCRATEAKWYVRRAWRNRNKEPAAK